VKNRAKNVQRPKELIGGTFAYWRNHQKMLETSWRASKRLKDQPSCVER
jgi:hypothetical protein